MEYIIVAMTICCLIVEVPFMYHKIRGTLFDYYFKCLKNEIEGQRSIFIHGKDSKDFYIYNNCDQDFIKAAIGSLMEVDKRFDSLLAVQKED